MNHALTIALICLLELVFHQSQRVPLFSEFEIACVWGDDAYPQKNLEQNLIDYNATLTDEERSERRKRWYWHSVSANVKERGKNCTCTTIRLHIPKFIVTRDCFETAYWVTLHWAAGTAAPDPTDPGEPEVIRTTKSEERTMMTKTTKRRTKRTTPSSVTSLRSSVCSLFLLVFHMFSPH